MKSAPSGVDDLLYNHDGRVDPLLFDMYLLGGSDVRHWTDAGRDITYGGNTYLSGVVVLKGGETRLESGLSVSTYEIEIAGSVAVGGAPMAQAAMGTAFDGARVVVRRAYFDGQYPSGTLQGAVVEFDGKVYGREVGSVRTKLTLKSPMAKAETLKGFRIIGSSCPFVVHDSQCGATVQEATATVASGSTVRRVNLASVPATAAPGARLLFTSGAMAGVSMLVRYVSSGYVNPDIDLPAVPAAGVTCVIRRGCDHSIAGCTALNNILRNGGAPSAPTRDLFTVAT